LRLSRKAIEILVIAFAVLLIADAAVYAYWYLRDHNGKSFLRLPWEAAMKYEVYLPVSFANQPAPAMVVTPTQTAEEATPGYTIYTIQTGDTMFSIAQEHDLTLEELVAANPQIDDPAVIYTGQEIKIPAAGAIQGTATRIVRPKKATATPTPDETGGNASPTPISASAEGTSPTTRPIRQLLSLVSEINGIPIDEIIVLPDEVDAHIREIYALGQKKGRDAHAFSKIGDSTIESPFFMDRFDSGPYNLGDYDFLHKVIRYYQGSFSRQGMAVQRGLHTWSLFDPLWADPAWCKGEEGPVDCELRLHNPSIVFIRLGSNDAGRPDLFVENFRRLIEMCLKKGVIPIIGTKADHVEGSDTNNDTLRGLAEEYDVPLWDFGHVAQTLPGNGVGPDGVHLTLFYPHDYTLDRALQTGYGVHNLTALMMLYEVWRITQQ
jgi:LysM repeat protein